MNIQCMVSAFRAAALVAMACVVVSAQDPNANAPQDRLGDRTQAGQLDPKLMGSACRLSQILGQTVYNEQGQDVGSVKDIVVDAEQGKIRYAALSVGGFLGINDRLFAIPWTAFEVRPERDNPNEHRLVLRVSKELLEKAPGFDEETWPNFGDATYTKQLDDFYRTTKSTETVPRKRATER